MDINNKLIEIYYFFICEHSMHKVERPINYLKSDIVSYISEEFLYPVIAHAIRVLCNVYNLYVLSLTEDCTSTFVSLNVFFKKL